MRTVTRWSAACLPALLLALPAPAVRAQQTVEGPKLKSGVETIQVGGRVQTQFNTTSVEGEPDTELFLRRVRLEVEVKVNDRVSGAIQPEFAGDRVSLKDVYLKLSFSPALQLLAGKAYKPFSLLEQTSSKRILPIERGAEIRGTTALDEYALVHDLKYSDRDVGVQVMGAPGGAPLGFAYAAGVFQGPLHQRVGGQDSYQYAARATVAPVDELRVGLGWSSRHFARGVPGGADPEVERGDAFEVDVEYGAFDPGVHFLGEVTWGEFDPFTGRDFLGAQGWLGYRTGRISPALFAVEPVFRASYGEVTTDAPGDVDLGGVLLTPGVTFWLGGSNRFMLNYDVWLPNAEAADTQRSFKAMFQLGF